jgi:hypothetical protein
MKRILISTIVGLLGGLVAGLVLGHKLPPTREQTLDHIGHLSVSELGEFNRDLKDRWGLVVYQAQLLPTPPIVPAVPTIPPK